MGEIVAAMATCHAPYLLAPPPDEKAEEHEATIAAMRELGRVLDETKPDVAIFFGSDHLETFSLSLIPTFAIVAGSKAVAEYAHREFERPLHRDLAVYLLDRLVRADFDMGYSEDAMLGHTFAVPWEFILERRDIPVVPFHTNVYLPPLPSPRRCAALGRAVAKFLEDRPERVALIASGGMSHYPGTPRYTSPNFEFDYWMIDQLEAGNTDALLDMTGEQLDEVGNTELLNWCVLLGAIGNRPGALLQYTPTWHHGHAMMQFIPGRKPEASKRLPPPPEQYGFTNKGFEFYVHPPAHAYKLNQFLYEVRTSEAMRTKVMGDYEAVAAEWGLTPEEKDAARAVVTVKNARSVSDHCAPLVRVGVHPLQALMSLHVIYADYRNRERMAAMAKTVQRP